MSNKTVHIGIRLPKPIKERFFDFCEKENISARKIMIYIVENFM